MVARRLGTMVALLILVTGMTRPVAAAPRPNVVFILTDDLSWNLINKKFAPHIVQLQKRGETFSALRQAFTAALHDRNLLEEAAKMRFDVGAMSGEDLQALTGRLFALPAKISERAKQALIYKGPGN